MVNTLKDERIVKLHDTYAGRVRKLKDKLDRLEQERIETEFRLELEEKVLFEFVARTNV